MIACSWTTRMDGIPVFTDLHVEKYINMRKKFSNDSCLQIVKYLLSEWA